MKFINAQTTLNCISIVAISSILAYLIFNKGEKIAYVDSSKILAEFKGSVDAKKAYNIKTKVWQANIDSLTFEIQGAIKKYEKDLAIMSPKEQSLSKQILGNKQKQLLDYQKAIQENARQEDAKLTQTVVAQINAFLAKYGKLHDYKMILIANQSGTIAYAKEGLDITKDVLEELNKDYSKK